MRLAIIFRDNDFQKTILKYLDLLWDALLNNDAGFISKEAIVENFNSVVPGLYNLCQHYWNGDLDQRVINNLKITVKNILFNKEIDEYIKQEGSCANGELFILSLSHGNCYAFSYDSYNE